MSDARLRELERRWKETGSPDDEAAYLLERVRVGDLTRERLELAAYCGHEGARKATGAPDPLPEVVLHEWAKLLPNTNDCIRVSVLAVRLAKEPGPFQVEVDEALTAAESWLLQPCDETMRRVVLASSAFRHRENAPNWFTAAGIVCDAVRASSHFHWLAKDAALSALRTLDGTNVAEAATAEFAIWLLSH